MVDLVAPKAETAVDQLQRLVLNLNNSQHVAAAQIEKTLAVDVLLSGDRALKLLFFCQFLVDPVPLGADKITQFCFIGAARSGQHEFTGTVDSDLQGLPAV